MKDTLEILKDYNITKETRHHNYDYLFSKLPEIMKKYAEQAVDRCSEVAKDDITKVWMVKNELK